MDLITVLYCLLFACLLIYKWNQGKSNFPPGPKGLPFVGVVPFLGKYPEKTFMQWSQKYGPVMSARMGSEDVVVLNDFDSIYKALVKGKDHFSGRCKFPIYEQYAKGHGILHMDYGERFRTQRKFGLTTMRGFGVGKKSMEERVQEELRYLVSAIMEHKEQPFDILPELSEAVANNICSVIFGQRFEYTDEKFKNIVRDIGLRFNVPTYTNTVWLLQLLPILIKIPPWTRLNEAILQNERDINKSIRDAMDDHARTFDPENPRDFIDAFRIVANENPKDTHFTEPQLLMYIRDVFVAGTETTTSTVRWTLIVLLHHPQIQKKMAQEIFDVLGTSNLPTMSHRPSMPYTCAFIDEIMRFRTLTPLNIPHKSNDDVRLNGYSIPKNTRVLTNLWAVHNDPATFPESERFKPERFLDRDGKYVPSSHVIPFALGPRRCLGEQLARVELFLFIVTLVQKFEFHPVPGKIPPLNDGMHNGITYIAKGFEVIARPR